MPVSNGLVIVFAGKGEIDKIIKMNKSGNADSIFDYCHEHETVKCTQWSKVIYATRVIGNKKGPGDEWDSLMFEYSILKYSKLLGS